jgi:hypothetical protein
MPKSATSKIKPAVPVAMSVPAAAPLISQPITQDDEEFDSMMTGIAAGSMVLTLATAGYLLCSFLGVL